MDLHALVITSIIALTFGKHQCDRNDDPLHYNIGHPPDLRIVGGRFAESGEAKHHVSLRYKEHNAHFCGGSIIGPLWILTAAHCLSGMKKEEMVVVAGSLSSTKGDQQYQVEQLIRHDWYMELWIFNDIGLVKVASEIQFSDTVAPISLPEKPTPAKTDLRCYGFGLTSFPGNISEELRYVDSVSIGNSECRRAAFELLAIVSPSFPVYFMPPNNICVMSEKGTGVCKGDSGGGLINPKDNTIVGVVSWGKPCAKGKPDVFTRVHVFLEWISKTMAK